MNDMSKMLNMNALGKEPNAIKKSRANERQVGGNHYKRGTLEHWDFAWQNDYDQFQYCITKYVHRHKRKGGIDDLRKAQHHLEKYIELLEAEPGHGEDVLPEGMNSAEAMHYTRGE